MSIEIAAESPLALALNRAIQPKLVEVGWSTGGADDPALSEYILLMLANGKTQDQIATELSGDLLNLGPDDPGAREFSQWLFQQAEYLKSLDQSELLNFLEHGSTSLSSQAGVSKGSVQLGNTNSGQDTEMGDAGESAEGNVPTGPKSMRNGANRIRDKRMFGHLEKAMDRSHDSALHRVRNHGGSERINTHARGTPTGPRSVQGRGVRPTSNRPGGMHGNPSGPAANVMAMTSQQQMELYALFEQQSRMMAQMFTPQQQQMMAANGRQPPMMNGNIGSVYSPQQLPGRSLFDRVQPNRHQNPGNRNGFQRAGEKPNEQQHNNPPPVSSMDMQLSPAPEKPSADTTCKFNLSCTNKDCIFAHQSPAAPPGTAIDISDICSFGAACKNRKCTARHPSPAQKIAHQTEQDCKFYPNCTNPRCPFRHPTMPLCRNGADCTTPNCKFTHVKIMCKFNPCLNPTCAFKHEEGQKRGKFDDKVWVADEQEHVSERKFVDENETVEELIVPGNPVQAADLVT